MDEDGTLDAVGDECNAAHDVGDELCPPQRITLHLFVIEIYLEVDEVRLVFV